MRLGIACESGGFRCVFVHGVLAGLERRGLRADVYAAVSASAMPAALAAVGRAADVGFRYWRDLRAARYAEGAGMAEMVLSGIERYAPLVESHLSRKESSRLVIVASEVIDSAVAQQTQGSLASRVGREQLLAMARGDDSWARANLRTTLFDTASPIASDQLTIPRFRSVAYATSRMLHAWRVSAEVDSRPFIDGSYTDGCPVAALRALGCGRVLAIGTAHDQLYTNLYRTDRIEATDSVSIIRPPEDSKLQGVDFTNASVEGLEVVFNWGLRAGEAWNEGG
jgi:predicted acylesterase/phospholipase RssA